jgi:hypothetical protein
MKRLIGLVALAVMLSFGTGAMTAYAGETPAPEKKEKKAPGGKLVFAGEEKKDKDKKKPGN